MSATPETLAAAAATARDVRVDRIGFAAELQKQYVDQLKSAVKGDMLEGQLAGVEGDFFEGRLVMGTVGTIDPARFWRLYKAGRITETDLVRCITIKRSAAEEYFSGKDLDRISDFAPATPQLRVSRKKGVEVKLVDALKGLGEAIA